MCAYNEAVSFEWDQRKAEANYKKHGVRFSECLPVFEDDYAVTVTDGESDPHEQRFISIGMGAKDRVLVVVYSYRGTKIRIISTRVAEAHERLQYEDIR
jgi:hypothetical protein